MFARKIIGDKQFKHLLSARFGSWFAAANSGLSTQAALSFIPYIKPHFSEPEAGERWMAGCCWVLHVILLAVGLYPLTFEKYETFLTLMWWIWIFSPLSQISVTSRFLELCRNLKDSFIFIYKYKVRCMHIKQIDIWQIEFFLLRVNCIFYFLFFCIRYIFWGLFV